MPEGESIFICSLADGSGIVIKVVPAGGKGPRLRRARPRRGGGQIRAKRGDKSKRRLRDQRKEANFEAGSGETEQGSEGEK